jgi:chromatin modification-related protein VID21
MAAAAQRQATMQGQLGMPNGVNQPQRNGTPNGANVSIPVANTSSQPGHPTSNPAMAARQHLGQQGMPANFPNGSLAGMPMNNAGVPQAQMQANMQNAQRMLPPDQVRMAMQRGAFNNPTNQQQFQLQQQQINMASSMAANMNIGNGMPNANMIASMVGQNMNSNMGSPMNGMSNNAGSPRMNQVKPQMQSPARPLSSGHMPQLHQIQNSLKASHPEWSSEQVLKSASDQLSRFMNKQRQQAMSAAAGTPSGMSPSPQLGNNMYHQNGGMQGSSPPTAVQSYQNQLVQQQQRIMSRQQQAGSPGLNQARPDSRSATPQNSQLGIPSPGAQQQPRT